MIEHITRIGLRESRSCFHTVWIVEQKVVYTVVAVGAPDGDVARLVVGVGDLDTARICRIVWLLWHVRIIWLLWRAGFLGVVRFVRLVGAIAAHWIVIVVSKLIYGKGGQAQPQHRQQNNAHHRTIPPAFFVKKR